ncbi:hypothetical protein BA896_012615 [Janthinobacterium lividum]|uniref:Uncharacterized protein n=1 Tax=Janthinobacterium lividum TaxID=29581 RepID=A0A1E8PTB5_9BURK|nr:hypothetical protein BA896_012615 [Janthinobacterium lividum]
MFVLQYNECFWRTFMRVVSTFIPALPEKEISDRSKVLLMAFDTLVDDRNIVVGITVGKITGPTPDDAFVSEIGRRIIVRVADHHKLNYPESQVVMLAGVQTIGNAIKRVRNILRNAPDQCALLIVCADDKVYDAAFPALCVDFKSANMQAQ